MKIKTLETLSRAREYYAAGVDDDIKAAAERRMLDLLTGGETIVVEKLVFERNPETGRQRLKKKQVTTTKRPTPKWVFDKLMPDELVEAIREAGGEIHAQNLTFTMETRPSLKRGADGLTAMQRRFVKQYTEGGGACATTRRAQPSPPATARRRPTQSAPNSRRNPTSRRPSTDSSKRNARSGSGPSRRSWKPTGSVRGRGFVGRTT